MKKIILVCLIAINLISNLNADSSFEKIPVEYFSYMWKPRQCISAAANGVSNYGLKDGYVKSKDLTLLRVIEAHKSWLLTEAIVYGKTVNLYFVKDIATCAGLNGLYGYR